MVVSQDGKSALTRFRLLRAYKSCSYAEAEILTGRTHQIRVHAANIGMPIAGDNKYSSEESLNSWKSRGLNRLFLHAQQLKFKTSSGEELHFDAPLPAPLKAVIDGLED